MHFLPYRAPAVNGIPSKEMDFAKQISFVTILADYQAHSYLHFLTGFSIYLHRSETLWVSSFSSICCFYRLGLLRPDT